MAVGTQEVGKLLIKLQGDPSQLAKTLKAVSEAVEKTTKEAQKQFEKGFSRAAKVASKHLKTVSTKLKAMGQRMTLLWSTTGGVAGGLAVRAFAKFDQAMTESTSIMKVTEEQVARMRQQALSLASRGVKGPEELARSYFFLASAGLDAKKSMQALPVLTKFATAGAFDMALATDLLTDAQSALGMVMDDAGENMKQMSRLADVLVRANTLANASVQQFSEALTAKSGAALRAVNKDVEEGVAVLAAYADQGIKASLAGENLNRVLLLLKKSAIANEKAHKKFGFAVFDAQGKMRPMVEIIRNLEQVLDGMSDKQVAATLSTLGFDARVQAAILPLIGASDKIARYEEELRKAGGTTEKIASRQMRSFSNQLTITKNLVTVAAIQIGQALAPALGWINKKLQSAIRWWNGLSPSVKKAVAVTGMIVAALGPLTIALGAVISSVSTIIGFLGTLTAAINPVVAAVAAAVAVVGAFAFSWEEAKNAAKSFVQKTIGFMAHFSDNMRILWDWIKNNWKAILIEFIPSLLKSSIKATIHNLGVAMRMMVRLFVAFGGWIGGLFKRVFSVDFLRWIWAGIKKALSAFMKFAQKAWEFLKSIFSGRKISMKDFLDQLGRDAEEGMRNINFVETAANIMKDEMRNLETPWKHVDVTIDPPKLKFDMEKQEKQAIEQAKKIPANAIAEPVQKVWEKANEVAQKQTQRVQEQAKKVKRAVADVNSAVTAGSEEFFRLLAKVQTNSMAPNPAAPKRMVAKDESKKAVPLLSDIRQGIMALVELAERKTGQVLELANL